MILRLTDGTTTVNLIGGPVRCVAPYVPRAPRLNAVEFGQQRDGAELAAALRENVAESVVISIADTTLAAVRAQVQSLERLLEQAKHRQQQHVGPRVYVEYRPDASGDVYRSEILYGTLELSPQTGGAGWLNDVALQATVAWSRRCFWEGPEVELALSNGHGSGTGGVTVYNCNDATPRNNWVAIAGAAVAGVIPATCRIEITNTVNDANRTYQVYIGHNVFSNPGSVTSVLEAETAAAVAGSAAAVANTGSSAGYYQPVSWSGDTEVAALRWAFTSAQLNAYAGGWFRILARFAHTPLSGIRITPRITFPSGTPLTKVAEAPETIGAASAFQDWGVLQIPPWLRGETDLYPVDLTIYARKTGGGSFNLDYVQLCPLDSYRVLVPRGYGAAYNITIIDDGMAGSLYTTGWSGSQKTGHYIAQGWPVLLYPGRDQRLYFLVTLSSGGADIARTHTVRVYYRSRRLTL